MPIKVSARIRLNALRAGSACKWEANRAHRTNYIGALCPYALQQGSARTAMWLQSAPQLLRKSARSRRGSTRADYGIQPT